MKQRASDYLRERARASGARADIEQLRRNPVEHTQAEGEPPFGFAIVQTATALYEGCICEIEILSRGRPSGLYYAEAQCYGALLTVGAVVFFVRHGDGTIELMAGGGASGNTSTNNYNLNGVILLPSAYTEFEVPST